MTTRVFGGDSYVVAKKERAPLQQVEESVRKILGDNMIVEPGTFNADSFYSAIDSRHGLHFTIRGRAEQVMLDIATHLIQANDPINLLLDKSVHRSYKVHVTRHELIGGEMEQVPERAPARVVSSREIKREIELVRYGNDVEVDTNLFADPPLAAADIERKVTFQKQQFEKKLIELGYEALRNDSTSIIEAYSRTIQGGDRTSRRMSAYTRYVKECLFAFNKVHTSTNLKTNDIISNGPANPFPKILTMARHAMSATGATPDAMIIPASIDLHNFSKDANATFSVTGVVSGTEKTDFPLQQVFVDPMTNLRIGVHYPLMDYAQSSRAPHAKKQSGLSSILYIVTSHAIDVLETKSGPSDEIIVYKAYTQSAVIGSKGSGELMIAYPQSTAHTIEVSPEIMRMQMRAYLGAAILRQENVIRIPHVFCEHIDEEEGNLTFAELQMHFQEGNVIFTNDAQKLLQSNFDIDFPFEGNFIEEEEEEEDEDAGKYVKPSATTSSSKTKKSKEVETSSSAAMDKSVPEKAKISSSVATDTSVPEKVLTTLGEADDGDASVDTAGFSTQKKERKKGVRR